MWEDQEQQNGSTKNERVVYRREMRSGADQKCGGWVAVNQSLWK